MPCSLRLALLVDPLSARLHGGGHVRELAAALRARGHVVETFGALGGGLQEADTMPSRARLTQFAPCAILAYDALSPTAYLGARTARGLAIPLFLIEPGHRAVGSWFSRSLTRVGETLWGAYVRRTARRLFALDEVAAEQARSEGFEAERVEVLPWGVDLARFQPGRTTSLFRKHGVHGRVLYAALQLDGRSGLETLVGAFAATVGSRGDWSLVITARGHGVSRARACIDRSGVATRVHLLTSWPREELPGLFASATLFAAPAHEDAERGRELARALASGVPVIASDLPRPRARLAASGAGLLAEPGDLGAWTAALRRATMAPEARAEWSRAARAHAERELSWERLAARLAAHLEQARDATPEAGAAEDGPRKDDGAQPPASLAEAG